MHDIILILTNILFATRNDKSDKHLFFYYRKHHGINFFHCSNSLTSLSTNWIRHDVVLYANSIAFFLFILIL